MLLAGGMRYAVPNTPGLAALWGDRAFACPYCHGWEHRDQRIGILGATAAAHRAALLRSWSEDLLVLADGRLAPQDGEALQAGGVPVDERRVAAVAPGVVVRFTDGEEIAVDALHVPAPMTPRDDLAARLGVATTELPSGAGFADVDRFGVTSVPECSRRAMPRAPATSPPRSPAAASPPPASIARSSPSPVSRQAEDHDGGRAGHAHRRHRYGIGIPSAGTAASQKTPLLNAGCPPASLSTSAPTKSPFSSNEARNRRKPWSKVTAPSPGTSTNARSPVATISSVCEPSGSPSVTT